ncbi:hypothetical protein LHJ74_12085 [Streptomyces sp. N2-109]|uniref:Uncharacterized protein n=1 Tax=Streptomyces gossypii TaxID=2883101 RepID=A0ABT2JRX2_9ACTN|nr:hypothetical protein [Streptomyces gossypii]MCT2590638.1 hypothetical protein [Streptomyces gossypii]
MDNRDISDSGRASPGRRIELNVPQVAGSAAAAVTGAILASGLSVYGTIIGAGVVSVVATTGGALYQHLFKRTSEQIREAARPLPRRVPRRGPAAGPAVPPALRGDNHPDVVDETPDMPGTPVSGLPADAEYSRAIPAVAEAEAEAEAEPLSGAAETRVLPAGPSGVGGRREEFGEATEHGRTRRTLRARLAVSAGVFALAMGAITGLEVATDSSLFGWWHGDDKGGTTIGRAVGGDRGGQRDRQQEREESPRQPAPGPSGQGGSDAPRGEEGERAPGPQREEGSGGTGGTSGAPSAEPDGGADEGNPGGSPAEEPRPGTPQPSGTTGTDDQPDPDSGGSGPGTEDEVPAPAPSGDAGGPQGTEGTP